MTMPDSKSTLSSESGAFLISGSAPDDLQDHGVDYTNFAAASKVSTTPNGATHHEIRQPEPRNSNISPSQTPFYFSHGDQLTWTPTNRL